MHIFNIDNKPTFIISKSKILFFINETDSTMQGFDFNEIQSIKTEHRYNPNKDLFLWLSIKIKNIHTPFLMQASLFEESLPQVFSILKSELQGKTKLELPSNTQLRRFKSLYKTQKQIFLIFCLTFLSLLIYHKLVPPTLDVFEGKALKQDTNIEKGFCSLKAKIAFASQRQESININQYCGLFSFWKLESSRTIPSQYLNAEFSSKTAQDWIQSSRLKLQEKSYAEALTDIENAIYKEADNEIALLYNAELYNLMGNPQKAIERDIKTLKSFPHFATIQQHLAQLYQENNKYEDAYKHFKLANNLQPSASTYIALAKIEEDKGFYQKSLSNYEKALLIEPNDPYLLNNLGLLYSKVKNFPKAAQHLKQAYLLNTKDLTGFLNFYEISLVTQEEVGVKEQTDFIKNFKNNQEAMMSYEMLNIIHLSLQNMPTQEQKETWRQRYKGQELNWSFKELNSWLDECDLEEEHKYYVKTTIRFFLGYQQAYKFEHQN